MGIIPKTLKTRINTGFYNKNTIESELEGSDFNGVFKMEWVRRMNNIRQRVTETVNSELIYN